MGCTLVTSFAASTLPPIRTRIAFGAPVVSVEAEALGEPSVFTSTVSFTAPMYSLTVIERSWLGSSMTCGARYVANPGLRTFISYSPACKALKTKLPYALGVVMSMVFGLWFVMTIVAFGMVASLG